MISRNVHSQIEFSLTRAIDALFEQESKHSAVELLHTKRHTLPFNSPFELDEYRVSELLTRAIAADYGSMSVDMQEWASRTIDSFVEQCYFNRVGGFFVAMAQLLAKHYYSFLVAYGTLDVLQSQDLRNAYKGIDLENAHQWMDACILRNWHAISEKARNAQRAHVEILELRIIERANSAK